MRWYRIFLFLLVMMCCAEESCAMSGPLRRLYSYAKKGIASWWSKKQVLAEDPTVAMVKMFKEKLSSHYDFRFLSDLNVFLRKGADPDALVGDLADEGGNVPITALSWAVLLNNKEVVAALIARGARIIGGTLSAPFSPLSIALLYATREATKMLLQHLKVMNEDQYKKFMSNAQRIDHLQALQQDKWRAQVLKEWADSGGLVVDDSEWSGSEEERGKD